MLNPSDCRIAAGETSITTQNARSTSRNEPTLAFQAPVFRKQEQNITEGNASIAHDSCHADESNTTKGQEEADLLWEEIAKKEESRTFSGPTGLKLSFSESLERHLWSQIAARKTPRDSMLPSWAQAELLKYMVSNQLFCDSYFGGSNPQGMLDRIYDSCQLHDETKNASARVFYKTAIKGFVRNFSKRVKTDKGYTGRRVEEGRTWKVHDAKYKRGYEHLWEDDASGSYSRRFAEISEIKGSMTYGVEKSLYTEEEIRDLQGYLTKALEELPNAAQITEPHSQPPSSPVDIGFHESPSSMTLSTIGELSERTGVSSQPPHM